MNGNGRTQVEADLHRVEVLREVMAERRRQDELHPASVIDRFHWLSVLGEELGEAHKAANEKSLAGMREELIHVAAVAVRIVELMDAGMLKEQQRSEGR